MALKGFLLAWIALGSAAHLRDLEIFEIDPATQAFEFSASKIVVFRFRRPYNIFLPTREGAVASVGAPGSELVFTFVYQVEFASADR